MKISHYGSIALLATASPIFASADTNTRTSTDKDHDSDRQIEEIVITASPVHGRSGQGNSGHLHPQWR